MSATKPAEAPRESPDAASGPPWDAICRALGIPRDVAVRLVKDFLGGAEAEIRGLEAAAAAGDAVSLARACHRLKGAAGSLRLSGLAAPAVVLEAEAKAGSVAGALGAAQRLRAEVERLGRGL